MLSNKQLSYSARMKLDSIMLEGLYSLITEHENYKEEMGQMKEHLTESNVNQSSVSLGNESRLDAINSLIQECTKQTDTNHIDNKCIT